MPTKNLIALRQLRTEEVSGYAQQVASGYLGSVSGSLVSYINQQDAAVSGYASGLLANSRVEVTFSANQLISGGNSAVLNFTNETVDTANAWDTVNKRYIAPRSELVNVSIQIAGESGFWTLAVLINGVTGFYPYDGGSYGVQSAGIAWCGDVRLNSGDTMSFKIFNQDASPKSILTGTYTNKLFITHKA